MEAIRAYYDGRTFVPTKPVKVKRNQQAIITLLNEAQDEKSKERARKAIKEMRGMFKGTGLSSEDFMARKEYEKSLEL
jgi:NADH:ubiquinone oxidoreductase subunit E